MKLHKIIDQLNEKRNKIARHSVIKFEKDKVTPLQRDVMMTAPTVMYGYALGHKMNHTSTPKYHVPIPAVTDDGLISLRTCASEAFHAGLANLPNGKACVSYEMKGRTIFFMFEQNSDTGAVTCDALALIHGEVQISGYQAVIERGKPDNVVVKREIGEEKDEETEAYAGYAPAFFYLFLALLNAEGVFPRDRVVPPRLAARQKKNRKTVMCEARVLDTTSEVKECDDPGSVIAGNIAEGVWTPPRIVEAS